MKIFLVDMTSSCGTYFVAYLQHAVVIANDKEEAKKIVAEKLKDEMATQINGVELLAEEIKEGDIIYEHYDSDY